MPPFQADEVTLDFLNETLPPALGQSIASFDAELIGGGSGVLGELARITLELEDGTTKSLVAKFSAPVPEAREIAGAMRFYEMEHRFYEELAHRLPITVPQCYFQHFDTDSQKFVLFMEDIDGEVVDQLEGCTLEQARTAVDSLAKLHAWGVNAAENLAWLRSNHDPVLQQAVASSLETNVPISLDKLRHHCPDWLLEFAPRFHTQSADMAERIAAFTHTVIHGDYRADNLVFHEDGNQTTLDWQIVLRGPGTYDFGYFMSQSLDTELRRTHGDELIDRYRSGLSNAGVELPEQEFDEVFRQTVAFCLAYPLQAGGAIDERFERSRKLIETMLTRNVAAIEDYDCFGYL